MIQGLRDYHAACREAAALDGADVEDIQRFIQEREAQAWRDRFWERGCTIWPLVEIVERLRAGHFSTLRDLARTYGFSLVTATRVKRAILRSGRMTFEEMARCLPKPTGLTDLQGNTQRDRDLADETYTQRRVRRNPGSPWSLSRGGAASAAGGQP